MRAVNGRVMIEVLEDGVRVSSGGIFIPERVKSQLSRGVVILADKELAGIVKEGEIVYFKTGLGYEVSVDDKSRRVMRSTDLELVVEAE